ncbi:dystrobrevin binding protein 1b isoform X1 [Notolabrus celidotus]|uniref:dystrobrevin binding protein 1b isoform X1 n=1 Tax=Notolabrus celidotus TaxID=1203425 RepID=UPI00149070DB|nr:dystrobrevin binding protein 1b isoform X1 [Notolabrus celidotus]
MALELEEGQRQAADGLGKRGTCVPNMRKGQRASSSSESEENQQLQSDDSPDQSSPSESSSDEESSPLSSTVEAEGGMKRSQRFSSSFSLEDDNQVQIKDQDSEDEPSPKNSNGVPVTEQVEAESGAECVLLEKQDTHCDTNQPQRSGLFRPQELWLAVTRCLSLRWPPCLSINRQTHRKLAYQADLDQSEDTQSSVSYDSTNDTSSSLSTSDDRDVTLAKHEEKEVKSKGVKSGPARFLGISRSSPRLPRAKQATDTVLASMILEKEMFLRIELVESGDKREDLCYRAEWKLSERTKELAEGVWLSRSQKLMD